MAVTDGEMIKGGEFKHLQKCFRIVKKLDGLPLCHKLTYRRQTVVKEMGHFDQCL